ncbi:hypothetical protein TUBRATIS_005020 [Tubulinosema ratisbonensis]|uniref:Uncharacterized protein n=1 Tax=Tubulinosema ratisbonensis TaxID=291195 RepID=A0A437APP3_9MICR|nr:hypothetical protein TUBRATIS_005020 [Tubulinosema ratisbonensis]
MKDSSLNKTVNLKEKQNKRLKNTLLNLTPQKNKDYYNIDSLTNHPNQDTKSYIKKLNNELTTLKEILCILKDKLYFYESNSFSIENEETNFYLERTNFISQELIMIHNDMVKEKDEEIMKCAKRINELSYENKKYKEIIYELSKKIKSQNEAERILNEMKKEFN